MDEGLGLGRLAVAAEAAYRSTRRLAAASLAALGDMAGNTAADLARRCATRGREAAGGGGWLDVGGR